MKCLERKNYVTYLKVIACILITNSHCREIYPSYFLAIGGGFGNSLFFILSGYCLANIKMPFIEWYKRRLKRLIIPTFFFALLSILYIDGIDSFFEKSVRDIILAYIDKYWFVVAILVYYIVFYYIFKKRDEKIVLNFLLIYLLFYAVWYCVHSNRKYFWIELEGFSLFKVYFYLGIMLVGGYLRLYGDRGGQIRYLNGRLVILCTGFSVVGWGAIYAVVTVLQIAYVLQFSIHFFVAIFCISCLILGIIYENEIRAVKCKAVDKLIRQIADSTLEIYLVQVTIPQIRRIGTFPVNLIIFFSGAIVGGIVFHNLFEIITKAPELARKRINECR